MKIRNKKTGEIIEVSEADLPKYGINTQQQSPNITVDDVKNAYLTNPKAGEVLQKAYDVQEAAKQEKELTPDEEKVNKAETLIRELEQLYLGNEGELPLSFAKEQVGGRLPGTIKQFQKNVAPGTFPESDRLNTFQRILESSRSTLAKAAGDSGNLALQEQILAGKALPDANSTPQEAVELFKSVRKKFDLPESDIVTQFENERLPELKKNKGSTGANVLDFLLGDSIRLAKDAGTAYGLNKSNFKGTQDELMSLGLALQKMAVEEKDPQKKKELLSKSSDIFAQVKSGSVEAQNMFSEDIGRNYGSRAASSALEIGTLAELPGIVNVGKNIVTKGLSFGKKAFTPALGEEFLKSGTKSIAEGSAVREGAVDLATKTGKLIRGDDILNEILAWGKKAKNANPNKVKTIDNIIESARSVYKGQEFTPKQVLDIWSEADSGFKASGKAGKTVQAGLQRAIRQGARNTLEQTTGKFEQGTKLIKQGIDQDKVLKPIIKSRQKQEIMKGLESPAARIIKPVVKNAGNAVGGVGIGILLGKLLGGNRGL